MDVGTESILDLSTFLLEEVDSDVGPNIRRI